MNIKHTHKNEQPQKLYCENHQGWVWTMPAMEHLIRYKGPETMLWCQSCRSKVQVYDLNNLLETNLTE